ncbi:hypothetical protein ACHQM5_008633 [Ranunculus cassubicifolius]
MPAILCLPDEITDLFVNKLELVEDFTRFSVACKSWQSYVTRRATNRRFSPWLMLGPSHKDQQIEFSCLSANRVFNLESFHTKEKKYWGSGFGWLVSFGLDLNILLVNPFSRLTLSLPPQSTFQHQRKLLTPPRLVKGFIQKFILSAPPTPPHSCVVLAITSELGRLSFARPGDEAWISVESPQTNYVDAIFYQGQFYAVDVEGPVSVIDINCPQPSATVFAYPPQGIDEYTAAISKFYLVEISGYLCYVQRFWFISPRGYTPRRTTRFKVSKLDFKTRRWIRVKDLGNHSVFLGDNTAFAILASDFRGFSPNCVYFSDDHYFEYHERNCDMGVYDLGDKTVKPIYWGKNIGSEMSRPIFIMPSL